MVGKSPKRTVVWPPTGRRMEVAAADVELFTGDGWRLDPSADGGVPAGPEPEPPAGAGDGDGEAGAPPPKKRGRPRKATQAGDGEGG